MPPPPPSQHDVHTWPMDDVLIYDHPKWQLFVGSLGCPIRIDKMQVKPDIVIAMNGDDRSRQCEPWDWYEHLAKCGTYGIAHLRYGGWDQTHANAFDAEQRSNEFKSVWRRSFQISDRFCHAGIMKTTRSAKVKGRVPKAK